MEKSRKYADFSRECGHLLTNMIVSLHTAKGLKGEEIMQFYSRLKRDDIDELFKAILTLKTEEDCYRFFEDICTVTELHAIAQRLQVAFLLDEDRTYADIEKETKASTATISRINKCLKYGADGYRLVIDRMKNDQ